MAGRTRRCDSATRTGRMRKAEQFADAYALIREFAGAEGELDVADAAITLAVHAGIAAADVICCSRLGEFAQGDNHGEALGLLRKAAPDVERDLSTLLGMKTRAGYSADPANRDMLQRAGRAMDRLMDAARIANAR